MTAHTIMAYAPGFQDLQPTPVIAGDSVDWKQNGRAGCYRCQVSYVHTDLQGRTVLHVRLLSHDGVPVERRVTYGRLRRIRLGIMAVYDPAGVRRLSV